MTEHTQDDSRRKRARWGSKRGWRTHSAKFSPAESEAIQWLADQGFVSSVDTLIHEATAIHLARYKDVLAQRKLAA